MSWRDCIQTAVDTGRISSTKGAQAHAAYDAAYIAGIVAGDPPGTASSNAAMQAIKDITSLKSAKRWERVNVMQRAHEIYTKLSTAKDPAKVLQEIVVDMEMAQETVRSVVFADLDRFMLKFMPQFAGLHATPNLKLSDDIVEAAYGNVKSPEAKAYADAVINAQETLRKWANMYGANIPDNPNAKLAQQQDSVRTGAVEEQEWVDDHINSLDWTVMKQNGKLVPVADRDAMLRRTYLGNINDGFDRGDTAQLHAPSLGSRLNRNRFLYYKDAPSYLAMQKKYGGGNFYEQTINMVEAMAKDISVLKTFGPSADSMKEYTKRTALRRASDLNTAAPAGKKNLVSKMKKQVALFDDEYRMHSWHITSADGNLPVQAFSTARTIAVNAVLGSSFIPNFFGDIANAKVMKRVVGMPEISVFRSYGDEFLSSKMAKAEAAQLGVVMENAISLTQGRVRYFGALDGPHWARRGSDITYRLGLVSYHTQVIRNAMGKQLLGLWANHAGTKFNDLPFAPFLIERGIDAAEWDAFRATPLKNIRGAKFLVPLDMWKAGDDAAKKTSEKFTAAMQVFIRSQVPDTNLRSRRAMGEFIDPNSVAGQSVRTLGSLMSFPASIWFNQLQRIAYLPDVRNKIALGAYYVTAMTMAGAAIVQAQAIRDGRNLSDVTSPEFWGKSLQAGGGLGVVGDLVFNSINMNNSPQFSSNPTVEWFEKLHKLTFDNLIDYGKTLAYENGMADEAGDDVDIGADAFKMIDASIPDLWQSRLIFERTIKDDFMRAVDPSGWERKQKYRNEYEAGDWWGPEQEAEVPRLETVVGG